MAQLASLYLQWPAPVRPMAGGGKVEASVSDPPTNGQSANDLIAHLRLTCHLPSMQTEMVKRKPGRKPE